MSTPAERRGDVCQDRLDAKVEVEDTNLFPAWRTKSAIACSVDTHGDVGAFLLKRLKRLGIFQQQSVFDHTAIVVPQRLQGIAGPIGSSTSKNYRRGQRMQAMPVRQMLQLS